MDYVAIVTLELNGNTYNKGDVIAPADVPTTKLRSLVDKGLIDAVNSVGDIADGSIAPAKVTGTAVVTNDARLSDTRTPTDSSVTNAKVNASAAIAVSKLAAGTNGETISTVSGVPTWASVLPADQVANVVAKSTVGNLLTANQATGTDTLGNTTGFIDQGGSPTFVSSTDEAVSGTKSLKVTWNGTSTNYIELSGTAVNNWFSVTPGSTVTVKAMNKAGADTWAWRVFWYQANETASATSSTVHPVATQSASWHAADATFIAPADAAFMYVLLYRDNGVNGDITYFDNLSVHFGAGGQWALPGTPITNLGFYTDESVGRRLFQWDANNSRWQQTYGDTGWRDVTGSIAAGLAATNPTLTLYVRRHGIRVSWLLFEGAAGTATGLVNILAAVPAGFNQTPTVSTYAAYPLMNYATGQVTLESVYMSSFDMSTAGWTTIRHTGSWSYTTTDAWPTTLPGTASGSIPA